MLHLIVYLPGAGGNHLKNLLCLNHNYANCNDLRPEVYESPEPHRPPGEVWCLGGRNLQEVFFDQITQQPDKVWLRAAHVGEMFQYQHRLAAVKNKKLVIIGVDQASDQAQLMNRQQRLGQHVHPYWLEEELMWLYQPKFVSHHFDVEPSNIIKVSLSEFWHRDFVDSKFQQIQQFLDVSLDCALANRYHRLWHSANRLV